MSIRHLLISIAIVFISGCNYVHNLRYELTPTPSTFEFVDQRSDKDKVDTDPQEPLEFSGYVVGDKHFTPDRLSILRHRLSSEVAEKLRGKRVVVTVLRSLNVNTQPTNLDAIVSGSQPISAHELGVQSGEQFRYWIICDIVIEVDGRKIQAKGYQGYNGPMVDYPTNHRNALMRAIDQVVGNL